MFQLDNEPEEIEPHELNPAVQQKNVLLASFENPAALSPYRLNPGYRRPAGADSDHGYSTMTPHEDSEHMGPTFVEPLLAGKHRVPSSTQSLTDGSRASSPIRLPKLRTLDEQPMQTTELFPGTTVLTKIHGDSHFVAHAQVHRVVDSH